MSDTARYYFSFKRASKYPGALLDSSVDEHCINCKRALTKYEYSMGACTTCMNEGKASGQIITADDQQREMHDRLAACGVPKKHQDNTADSWRGAWPLPVRTWGGKPWSVYLHGEPGTGKTHIATALLRQWVEENRLSVRWTTMADLLMMLKGSQDKWADAQRYISPKLLVLDELKTEDVTSWEREQIVYVIKRRYEEERALVVTSNVAPIDLTDFEPSLVSRLAEGIVVHFEGPDYRLKAGR